MGLALRTDEGVEWDLIRRPSFPRPRPRRAVRILMAGESIGAGTIPGLHEAEPGRRFRRLTLPALAGLCLARWTRNDRVSLQDFLEPDVGLLDAAWPARYDEPLRSRLQALIDDPDG